MFGTTLVDIPLESRDRVSPLKKLSTAVSFEAPDLFRIHGVPCIDRGPDNLKPPVAYEHWNNTGNGGRNRSGGEGGIAKKIANFARPSSVSADTPNFFKVPGVAINSSSAITGVEAVCSPPPQHQPFSLPETYMHGKDVQAVADPPTLPGRWRETDREVGQWGHTTREFHQALVKMRQKSAAQAQPKGSTPLPHPCRSRPVSSAGGRSSRPELDSKQSIQAAPTVRQRGVGADGVPAGDDQGQGQAKRDAANARTRPRRVSEVEAFMSRLEGERGPQNRRESIAAYQKMLIGCTTNNSAILGDNASTSAGGGKGSNGAERVDERDGKRGTELRKVLARREAAHSAVSGLMGTAAGSYMLSRGRDSSKISLGSTRPTNNLPVGVVRVAATRT